MPIFQDADEVYRFLGGMIERGLEDDGLATSAARSGVVARLSLVEPECQLIIDLPGRRVIMGEAGEAMTTSVSLEMKVDDAHALWLGRVQPAVLIARRRVRIRGSVRKLLKLHSLGEQLSPVYEGLLREANRHDLLAPEELAEP